MNKGTGCICEIELYGGRELCSSVEFLFVFLTLSETGGGRGERKGLAVCKRKLEFLFSWITLFLVLRILNSACTMVSPWYQIHGPSGLESMQRGRIREDIITVKKVFCCILSYTVTLFGWFTETYLLQSSKGDVVSLLQEMKLHCFFFLLRG